MHNVDETVASMKKFKAKRARANFGEPTMCEEWYIADAERVVYSVIADYTFEGWATWRIFYNYINHYGYELFLKEDLQYVLGEGDCVLNDGASIHLVDSTLELLHKITNGLYITGASYSHDLFPVERGFANVWGYIRSKWDPGAGLSPTDLINEAFIKYSVLGEWGYKANEHWNIYKNNHQLFLQNL